MPLPAAEHARVKRESMAERNARAWVRRRGGTVVASPYFGVTHYMVKIPHLKPGYGLNLVGVVAALRGMVDDRGDGC